MLVHLHFSVCSTVSVCQDHHTITVQTAKAVSTTGENQCHLPYVVGTAWTASHWSTIPWKTSLCHMLMTQRLSHHHQRIYAAITLLETCQMATDLASLLREELGLQDQMVQVCGSQEADEVATHLTTAGLLAQVEETGARWRNCSTLKRARSRM